MKKLFSILSVFLFVFWACSSAPRKQVERPNPRAAAQARILALETRIDSLKALPSPSAADERSRDSLATILAAERANLEMMGKAQGYEAPDKTVEEAYEENQKTAREDRSRGIKPSPYISIIP